MKFSLRSLLFAALLAAVLLVVFFPSVSVAQSASEPASSAVTAAEVPSFLTDLVAKHSWLVTVFLGWGIASNIWQVLIVWLHKRAAETADDDDDKWVAALEEKAWFRWCDRFFYWGGYLGSRLGGKKL